MTGAEATTPIDASPTGSDLGAQFDAILARVEASALRAAERNADTTIVNNATGAIRDTARSNRQ